MLQNRIGIFESSLLVTQTVFRFLRIRRQSLQEFAAVPSDKLQRLKLSLELAI